MKIRRLESFDQDYGRLPAYVREKVDKQLDFLTFNPRHPSLKIHRIAGTDNVWECYIDIHYRFTFMREGDLLILRRIGTHKVLERP